MIGTAVGSYRILRQIGEGGMGRVYLAEHSVLGKRAAVKVLLPEFSANSSIVTRFFNEARTCSQLEHPGIIDIYDFGQLPDGSAFILMEYLVGESLQARLERQGPLPLPQIVDIARQVAGALSVVHVRGIVHRDLKPDNVFLLDDPETRGGIRAKVLDFGVAKLAEGPAGERSNRTGTGALIGTPLYMSPEQCLGAGVVDHRADIYALGCVMFAMATGGPPFVADGPGELITAHMHYPPPSLAGRLPAPLDAAVARMLAKRPDERFDDMTEVALLLSEPAVLPAAGEAALATAKMAVVAQATTATELHKTTAYGGATTLGSAIGELSLAANAPRQRTRRWLLPAAAGLLLAAGGVVYVGALRPARKDAPAAPTNATAAPTNATAAPTNATAAPTNATAAPTNATAAPTNANADRPPIATAANSAPANHAANAAYANAAPTDNAPAVNAAPRSIAIEVLSQPAGADLYRSSDGVRLGKTPWRGRYVPSSGEAVFQLRHKGYRDSELAIPLAADTTRSVVLQRPAHHAAAPSPSSTTAPTSGEKKRNKDGVVDPFAN